MKISAAKKFNKSKISSTYENFPLWSSIYLKNLMPDLSSLYYFCRTVDDYGDLPSRIANKKLSELEKKVDSWYSSNQTISDEYSPLKITIKKYNLEKEGFQKLIYANYKDIRKNRYHTFEEIIDYCSLSANPVGRFILQIFDKKSLELYRLSDSICTGLQITNFLQDVSRDYKLGRIYLPLEDLEIFKVKEDDIANSRCTNNFKKLMEFESKRCWEMFNEGSPLINYLEGTQKIPISIFIHSGRKILNKIKKRDFEILDNRPTVSKFEKITLIAQSSINYILKFKLVDIKKYDA